MGAFLDVLPIVKAHIEPSSAFIETGTWTCDSFLCVMRTRLMANYLSVEGKMGFYEKAVAKMEGSEFGPDDNWNLYCGDSAVLLPHMIDDCHPENQIVFYLDAHFPSHYGYDKTAVGKSAASFPTLSEVRTIVNGKRDHSRDVIVIDDLHLFKDTQTQIPYTQKSTLFQFENKSLVAIEQMLFPTHHVMRVSNGRGFIIALPKVAPHD